MCLNFRRVPAEPMARLVLLGHSQVPSQTTSSVFNVLLPSIYLHLPSTGSPGKKPAPAADGDRDVVLVAELALTWSMGKTDPVF